MKNKIISGLFWIGISQIMSQVMQLTSGLVLAALLTPKDFGIFGLAGIVVGWLGLVKSLGLDASIVYNNDNIDEATNAAFWILQIAGLFLWFIAILLASPAALFFKEPRVAPIIMVAGIGFPLTSLKLVQGALLQKRMDFKQSSWPLLFSGILGTVTTIGLALAGFSYWSLLLGGIPGSIVVIIFYWRICPFKPHFPIKWRAAKKLWKFGNYAAVNNILIFVNMSIDNAFVGKLLGTVQLGFYDFAYRMGNVPCTRVTWPVYQIMFPAFTKANQQGLEYLRQLYQRTIRHLGFAVFPLTVAVIVAGPVFFYLLYGAKWDAAMGPMKILAIYGLVEALAGPVGTLFYALGKPQYVTYRDTARLLFVCALAYFAAIKGGIAGVSLLFTGANIIFGAWAVMVGNRFLKMGMTSFLNNLWPAFCAGIVMAVTGLLALQYIQIGRGITGWFLFFGLCLLMCATYLIALLILDKPARNLLVRLKKGWNKQTIGDVLYG